MISSSEFKKKIKAINNLTKNIVLDTLNKRWLEIMSCDEDPLVIGLSALYVERAYSSISGLSLTDTHDLFIDKKENGNLYEKETKLK